MKLIEYFDRKRGLGVLSTADGDGKVDAYIYARPYFIQDGTLAFIMRDPLSHHKLQSNPYATYLFKEEGTGYSGKRLFLTRAREEKIPNCLNPSVVESPFTGMVRTAFWSSSTWTKNCRW